MLLLLLLKLLLLKLVLLLLLNLVRILETGSHVTAHAPLHVTTHHLLLHSLRSPAAHMLLLLHQ